MLGKIAIAIVSAGLLAPASFAAVFDSRNSSADTTLIGIAPTNNNGGQQWVNVGAIQIPPTAPFRNRGLFKFDFSDLPANAVILTATLKLEVTRVPDEPPHNSSFGLHRMLRPWGEGNKVAITYPGQGVPADPGEATWFCAFATTNAWAAPGGADGVDFVSGESSFQAIGGLGVYEFPFTPELAADVQLWVSQPEINFGWMLICNDEAAPFTSRRFGSREDPSAHPNLEIEYLVPPLIDSAACVSNRFELSFTPWPGQGYAVQFRHAVTNGEWTTLTNLGVIADATPRVVTDSVTAPMRFYRLLSY